MFECRGVGTFLAGIVNWILRLSLLPIHHPPSNFTQVHLFPILRRSYAPILQVIHEITSLDTLHLVPRKDLTWPFVSYDLLLEKLDLDRRLGLLFSMVGLGLIFIGGTLT